MTFEWDDAKREDNRTKHAVDFADVGWFDWDRALEVEDVRYDYGERRWRALGLIDGRLHALVYARRGDVLRVISLRRANDREVKLYDAA